jgi:hypothetical protein
MTDCLSDDDDEEHHPVSLTGFIVYACAPGAERKKHRFNPANDPWSTRCKPLPQILPFGTIGIDPVFQKLCVHGLMGQ